MAGPWRSCHELGVGVGTLTLKKPCVIFSTLKVWKEAQRGEGMHLRIPGQREQRSWDLTPGSGVLGVHYWYYGRAQDTRVWAGRGVRGSVWVVVVYQEGVSEEAPSQRKGG